MTALRLSHFAKILIFFVKGKTFLFLNVSIFMLAIEYLVRRMIVSFKRLFLFLYIF